MEENNISKKEKVFKISTYFCLALSLVAAITNMIYTILTSPSISDDIFKIIITIIIALISIILIFVGLYIDKKKVKLFIIICSILISLYSIITVILGINTPKDKVLDFTGFDIKDVVTWAEERNILIEQIFENSDTIEKYKVIKQDIKEGTSVSKINKIKITVSDGPDTKVSTIVDNMIGWNLDDVITYIDENHLTNVTILFEFSDTVKKDIIISQDIIKEIKRDEPITITSSLGKEDEMKNITMENLVGLDTFHALVYLGRNNLKYSIEYNYSEEKDEGIILKQSIKKWDLINPKDNIEVVLTVSKKNEVTIPDFTKMNATEINTWAANNRLKVEFTEEYDDTIKKGRVVSSNYKKGNTVEIGTTIEVILSKGELRMTKFTTVDEFETWANEHSIAYNIEYEFNDNIEKGKLISSSHKENQIIKNEDTISLVISQGGNTIIPNLLEMTKTEAEQACKKANIKCSFVYANDNNEFNIVTKQSMRSGSNVPTSTTITVTLGK